MKAFFEGIQDLFVNFLFAPYDFFRFLSNWWASNAVNWLFFIICFVAFAYWMLELKKYNDNGEEDKSSTAHTYL
mgnify:CR=1|tara:strand:+ start:2467 stop:2688 length:222 start_codon:yes stop_codon:yes gene_type:complete